jgi:hypothetical protein
MVEAFAKSQVHWPSLSATQNKRTILAQILETQGEHNPTSLSSQQKVLFDIGKSTRYDVGKACPLSSVKTSLVDHICNDERERRHLKLLAQCIGFETSPGDLGVRGDLSCLHEWRRLHCWTRMHWDWKSLAMGAGFLRMHMLCSFAIKVLQGE